MYRCYHLSLRCVVLLLGVWVSATCSAQVRRYQPATPTVSPYLNLSRFQNGAIPNYYTYVKPALRQREINRQERAFRRQQTGSLRRLQNDVQLGLRPAATTGTGSWFMTPSTRSTYLDTSDYYPGTIFRGRR